MDLKLIKEYRDVNFVYELPSMEHVTLSLVDNGVWPEKAKTLAFQLNKVSNKDFQTLWGNIGEKYFSRLYYYIRKENILVGKTGTVCGLVKRHAFSSKEEMADVYIRTIAEFFWKPWEKYVFGFYGKENSERIITEQARTYLEYDQVIAHEKDGKVVSFLAYKPLREPISGRDVDWVLWVWISPEIQKDERQYIRAEFSDFLKTTKGNQWVVAVTEPFNTRPNIFWQSLGFKLGCVAVNIKK